MRLGTGSNMGDVRVMLWASSGQCDWLISASDKPSLKAFAAGLLDLSNLRQALYSSTTPVLRSSAN